MADLAHHYCVLLNTNEAAFAQNQYFVAYHALSAAMHCALGTRDIPKMKEVLYVGSGQLDALTKRLGDAAFPNEPVEVSLYHSLIQMARTRLLLLESA